jgi:hypothetical protein
MASRLIYLDGRWLKRLLRSVEIVCDLCAIALVIGHRNLQDMVVSIHADAVRISCRSLDVVEVLEGTVRQMRFV